ncbi:hypothetical protein FACS189426_03270 [Bacteroidia bacterium]|nr:hypothetical protein FACS189426_03270 [Bacteroidia bacterium]
MSKRIPLFLILILFSAACSKHTNEQAARKGDKVIALDIEQNDEVSIKDYFSHIEFIPLETDKRSVLGQNIKKWLIYKGNFYFLDHRQGGLIVVFDSKGKFIRTIDKKGQGPGEYSVLYDFSFNRFTGNLELMDALCYIHIYDESGDTLKETIRLPKGEQAIHFYTQLTPDIYVFFNKYREKNKLFFYSISKQEIISETYSDWPDYMNETPFGGQDTPFHILNDTVCFYEYYSGDIFTIDAKTMELQPRYQFDFGEHNFTISKIPENETMQFYLKFSFYVTEKYVTFFSPVDENSNYYISRFYYKKKAKQVILDKRNKQYKIFNAFKEGFQCMPYYMDEEAMYAFVPPNRLDFVVKPEVLDEENLLRYKSVQEDSNPVIIKYYFK